MRFKGYSSFIAPIAALITISGVGLSSRFAGGSDRLCWKRKHRVRRRSRGRVADGEQWNGCHHRESQRHVQFFWRAAVIRRSMEMISSCTSRPGRPD